MKDQIQKLLEKALKSLKYDTSEVVVDYPKNEAFGDYTTNVAMVLARLDSRRPLVDARQARSIKKNPMEIAKEIVGNINRSSLASFKEAKLLRLEVVKPGYINFYLSKKYLQDEVAEINKSEKKYGDSKMGENIKINNEFISANPTGPLTIGNGRGGFCGDVISNVLKKCGYKVISEYYVNDAGEQVIKLGHSVKKDSEAAYAGDYIDNLNKEFGNKEDIKEIGEKSAEIILNEIIKKTLSDKMKIEFDSWISEKKDIIEKKYNEKAIEILKNKKLTYESEDALWLKTTEFGDDKDRVLIKKNGQKTYFASDCGYILYKIEKGFDKIIEIWGADHHGYVSRFKAAAEALGFKGELKFIIVQLVRLVKDGKEARMSKRAGNVVYIDELIDKVGLDVARFFFLMYSPDTHMNFDLKLAMEKSEKNPVYYVQYAHARIASIIKKSENKKYKADLSLLVHEKELNLIRELQKFPELVEEISQTYAVHKLPYYAITLANKFHSFYNDLKVIDSENIELTSARLELIKAVRIVLAEALRIMGVSAPDKM